MAQFSQRLGNCPRGGQVAFRNPQILVPIPEVAQGIKAMILALEPATEAGSSRRWLIGLSLMLFSIVVLAQNATRLNISPAYDDDRLSDEIYSSAGGWRSPPEYESEWRPEKQEQQSRIQFGYDSAYEEMRARDNNYTLNPGLGLKDHPQNAQFKIGF